MRSSLVWLIIALCFAAVITLGGCSTLTTPLRDCKSMCAGGKVTLYASEEGERCECREASHE